MDEKLGAVIERYRPVGVGGAMPNHWSCAMVVHCSTEEWKKVYWTGKFECSWCLEKSLGQPKMSAKTNSTLEKPKSSLKAVGDPT